jgi:PDZ domain
MRNPSSAMVVAVAGLLFTLVGFAAGQGRGTAAIDAAFARFLDAGNPADAAAAAAQVVQSGVSVDEAYARLTRGRTYAAQAPRGVVRLSHRIGQSDFGYTLDVPEHYDASRAYQVRVHLHGGVTGRQDASARGAGSIGALAGAEQIYVLPTAWNDAPWWSDTQVQNLRLILDRLKRTYNVDENHVVLSGVSDGGTAAYFVAMRDTTPFAGFLPLNGALPVLANDSLGIDGDLLPNNLRNKPWFVVNGMRDPLYPPALVEPYTEHLRRNGVDLTYRPQAEGVHNTAWWPDVRDSFEAFVRDHPRVPHPATLSWETDGIATSTRAHWLVIDEVNPQDQREPLPDLNRFVPAPLAGFGVRVDGTRVTGVLASSSASTFDLKPGDIVTAVNGQLIPKGQGLLEFLATVPADTFVTLTAIRGDDRVDLRGYFSPGASVARRLFTRAGPVAHVDLVRDGNSIRATTRHVSAFTLLISPEVFDFTRPVKVVADGRTVFDGRVTEGLDTLMKWAARDNDRTMLYEAEITVRLPK